MKRLCTLFIAILAVMLSAAAQTRTYGDIESKAFVIGLDQYYFGDSGSLSFKVSKKPFEAKINGDTVLLSHAAVVDTLASRAETDFIVGIHDFTGDKVPELVVASRSGNRIVAEIFKLGDETALIGRIGAEGEGITDIRVFRQAITVKNHKKGAMYTWTWHAKAFDFKASDGSSDPTPAE